MPSGIFLHKIAQYIFVGENRYLLSLKSAPVVLLKAFQIPQDALKPMAPLLSPVRGYSTTPNPQLLQTKGIRSSDSPATVFLPRINVEMSLKTFLLQFPFAISMFK